MTGIDIWRFVIQSWIIVLFTTKNSALFPGWRVRY